VTVNNIFKLDYMRKSANSRSSRRSFKPAVLRGAAYHLIRTCNYMYICGLEDLHAVGRSAGLLGMTNCRIGPQRTRSD